MGGFGRAMPFTFLTFTAGSLALAGFPFVSGFFSKDEILAFTFDRGGGYVVLAVVGYLAAFLTAFYAFRMVFRVFYRTPVPEARELERGHLAHAEPENPMTGEREDPDVGFPGPEHHVAEREPVMRAAMGPLAVLSIVAGAIGIPGVITALEHFLEPSFEDSRYLEQGPSDAAQYVGLAVGGALGIAGLAFAALVYLRRRSLRLELRERFSAVHTFLFNKWYFDELYDLAFVRPAGAFGRFGRTVIESALVQGVLVGGASGVVRAGSSFARAIQTGYLRAYALLLLMGLGGMAFYFLLVSA
jgi:NADH-quinone oxidoreductase subunit L